MDEKSVAQLVDMGASRPAAMSALRACRGDINEAAIVVFDSKHANATAIQEDISNTNSPLPTTSNALDISKNEDDSGGSLPDSMQEDDFAGSSDDENMHDEIDFFATEHEEAGADPFAQISFKKDRKEVMVEIEESPEIVKIDIGETAEMASIMPQSEWMKGCAAGNEQSFLFQIYSRLTDSQCICPAERCAGAIPRHKTDFFAIPATFTSYIEHLQEVVQAKCPECNRTICLACSEEVSTSSFTTSKQKSSSSDPPDALIHCPDLQAVILGVGLSLVENMYYAAIQQPSGAAPNFRPAKKTKLETAARGQDGDINGQDDLKDAGDHDESTVFMHTRDRNLRPKGVGYGGVTSGRDDQSGQEAAFKVQLLQDQTIASLLASVRIFMPNRDREGPFRSSDHMPSIATAIHIRRRFNPIASELLKNDSLSDMSDRRILYEEFLAWLAIISAHENLGSIMGQPIMRVVSVRCLPATVNASGNISCEKEITYEGSAGPRELLENLWRQVKAAKRAMNDIKADPHSKLVLAVYHHAKAKETEEVERLEAFCEQFQKAVNSIDRSLEFNNNHCVIEAIKNTTKAHLPVSHDLSSVSIEVLKQRYLKWAESTRYQYFDFEIPAFLIGGSPEDSTSDPSKSNGPKYMHAFSRDIANVYSFPARNTAIAREHSTLSSSLPVSWDSSVFLRVDESRPDVLKVLITGPEGTPYSNGCFVFDILFSSTYNQSPPLVKTMTTNNGKYRLNPNLYADGKVCLSLLGTWSGPGWIPGKSTLLQVLISIQSMILNEEPYLNEPGWAGMSGTPQSRAYNLNVRRMVVDDAMIQSLKNPHPAFKEVIKTHFKLKSQVIKTQLEQWLADDDGQPITRENTGGAVAAASVGYGKDNVLKRNVLEMMGLLDDLIAEPETDENLLD